MKPLFSKPTSSPKPCMDINKARTVLLFDASNLAARAHHAFWARNKLATKNGLKSGHIFGVLSMIRSAFEKFRKGPTAIVIALEGYPALRYALFPGYKAHRRSEVDLTEGPPEDPRSEQISAMLSMPVLGLLAPSGEADDAIASMVSKLGRHQTAYVFSSDRDLWQLVSTVRGEGARVSIVLEKHALVDARACKERMGVAPNQVALLKSLYGDSSDGIPKVPRMPKRFKDDLYDNPHWQSPGDLIAELDQIDQKIAYLITAHQDQIEQMYDVVTLDTASPYILDPFGSKERLKSIINQLELKSLRELPENWF